MWRASSSWSVIIVVSVARVRLATRARAFLLRACFVAWRALRLASGTSELDRCCGRRYTRGRRPGDRTNGRACSSVLPTATHPLVASGGTQERPPAQSYRNKNAPDAPLKTPSKTPSKTPPLIPGEKLPRINPISPGPQRNPLKLDHPRFSFLEVVLWQKAPLDKV